MHLYARPLISAQMEAASGTPIFQSISFTLRGTLGVERGSYARQMCADALRDHCERGARDNGQSTS